MGKFMKYLHIKELDYIAYPVEECAKGLEISKRDDV
jgi:hypothetical protein